MTLLDSVPDKKYFITNVLGSGNRRRRLLDMGFTPGAVIKKVSVAPFGETILIELHGSMIALRKDAALLIEIEV